MDLHDAADTVLPFHDAERWLGPLDASAAAMLASAAGDVALILNPDGVIKDVASSGRGLSALHEGIGRHWTDVVTVESRPKVTEMLADAGIRQPRWRQINHPVDDQDIPVRYFTLRLDGTETVVAIGRDMRASAALQQRLLQVQQSLERDYLRLRQAESRYRLLFDLTAEPVMIVEAANRRIREVNPATYRLTGIKEGALAGQSLTAQVAEEDRERLIAYLGAAAAGASSAPVGVRMAESGAELKVHASAFRQSGTNFFLIRLSSVGSESAALEPEMRLLDVVERMPDAFLLADAAMTVVTANPAFAEIVQAASVEQLRGRSLGDFLGRPGIDLDLILGQLSEHGVARNVATILRGLDGGQEEVEVSAVRASERGDHFGFSLRVVGRRLRDLPPAERDLPRSVEQLTELVGRMPLKDIVRESTDLIERLCIEAALAYTSNNRASAAEILGLSRQSLYSKLHRHGLGNLGGETE
jgi:transcriptional regulator PpsR